MYILCPVNSRGRVEQPNRPGRYFAEVLPGPSKKSLIDGLGQVDQFVQDPSIPKRSG